MNQVEKLRSLIRESINEYIREIDEAGSIAALEAKELKCEEAINARESKIARIDENEDLKEMVDANKIKELQNEIKILEKAKKKYAAQKAKLEAKKDKKSAPKEDKEVTTDAPVKEADVTAEMDMKDEGMKEEALNESFLKMQKLAGVITEAQYREKVQMLSEEITVGGTYTASMPTSSDSKEKIDVKVKVLGKDSSGDYVVEPLEDKRYKNPASGQENEFSKGKQYSVKAEFLKEAQYREKVQMLNEGYKFNDANEDTAKEIKNKIKPAIENTLKKAMMDISTKNPELKGAPNYGLAVGLIAYDIVMDLA